MSGWGVYEAEGDVHVVPVLDDEIVGHELSRSCECRPTPLRDTLLDEPVWSHNHPDWPGANEVAVH